MGGLAALMGILGGTGRGALHGYDAAVEDQQKAARLAEAKRHSEATEAHQARSLDQVDALRRDQMMLPYMLEQAKSAADRERESTRQKTLGESLLGLDDPEMQTLGGMLHAGGVSHAAGEKAALSKIAPKPSDAAALQLVLTQDGTQLVTGNKKTGALQSVQPTGLERPEGKQVYARKDIEAKVDFEGYTRGSKEWQDRYNDLARQIPIQAGGEVRGAGTGLGGVNPGPAPASSTGPTPPNVLASRPFQPTGTEREDLALADTAVVELDKILATLQSGSLNSVLGGVAKNPWGAVGRVTETYGGFGQNDVQRQAMGAIGLQLQKVKHSLIGATRTMGELADIRNAVPDEKSFLSGDTVEQMVPKLRAMRNQIQSSADQRRRAMQESNVQTPPAPKTAAPTGPTPKTESPVVRWGRDANGRPVRLP